MRINIRTDDLHNSDLFFDLDTIQINSNDTIVVTIDPNYIPLDMAGEVAEALKKTFPSNDILCILKGAEISTK